MASAGAGLVVEGHQDPYMEVLGLGELVDGRCSLVLLLSRLLQTLTKLARKRSKLGWWAFSFPACNVGGDKTASAESCHLRDPAKSTARQSPTGTTCLIQQRLSLLEQ